MAWIILRHYWEDDSMDQHMKGPWAFAMFAGASELGCKASCISLARMVVEAGHTNVPLFKPIIARFRNIVREGNDPNALSIEARDLMKQEKYNAAGRWAQRALYIAGGEDFEFEADAHHVIGIAYAKAGKKAEAREHFTLASDLGLSTVLRDIAELSDDLGEKRECLYKLGCTGFRTGFKNLGELTLFLGEHPLLPPAERERQRLMALEWMRLSDKDSKY